MPGEGGYLPQGSVSTSKDAPPNRAFSLKNKEDKMDTEVCDICKENVLWYEFENHMDAHYEGAFDREMDNRISQAKERI